MLNDNETIRTEERASAVTETIFDPRTLSGLRWQECDSSSIRARAYSAKTKTLFLEYQGKRADRFYAYHGVSRYENRQLALAESLGRFVNLHIKPKHECSRFDLSTIIAREAVTA